MLFETGEVTFVIALPACQFFVAWYCVHESLYNTQGLYVMLQSWQLRSASVHHLDA